MIQEGDKMKKKKLFQINRLSGLSFLISSLSLLAIPFINIGNGLTASAYIVAALFWIGLLLGSGLQIFLSVKCKSMKKKKWKNQKLFYIVSALAFILLIIFVIAKINIMFLIALMLFISILSIEAASVIKKEMYLK